MAEYTKGSLSGKRTLSPQDRFNLRVQVDETTGCHIWLGSKARWGYGTLRLNGKKIPAHRFAWEQIHGPVPLGLVLDHLCRNTSCVNPEHLEPVTGKENILRSQGRAAQNARRTVCVNGHPFDFENTGRSTFKGKQHRYCRTCSTERSRKYRAAILGERERNP